MRRIRVSNLFHSVGAAKLKDLSKKVLEQFLLTINLHYLNAYLLNYSSFLLIQTNTWERNGQQKL